MALSSRSQRYLYRTSVLLVLVFLIAQTYTIATIYSGEPDSISSAWSRKPPISVWDTPQTPLSSIYNVEIPKPGASEEVVLAVDPKISRMNATFVSLARNSDLQGLLSSIRNIEERFNKNWHYDWVFLNEQEFTEDFKTATTAMTSGRASYGKVDEQYWSYPDFINTTKADEARYEMRNVYYGDSASYRHMCRYQSGFFYNHPLVAEYEWYWRVEPDIQIFCDIPYDPFRWMAENGKKYSFVITLNELGDTVPNLWKYVKGFMKAYPEHLVEDNHFQFMTENDGETWSYCHFWSNFEIASLEWYRSKAYNDFFEYMDRAGGFFYERWGDASIHSIAAALTLKKGEIHFFDDIGYRHSPLTGCPKDPRIHEERNCACRVEDNQEFGAGLSCLKRFMEVTKMEFPVGFERNLPLELGIS